LCVATWFGLLGEMRLASGDTVEAAAALGISNDPDTW